MAGCSDLDRLGDRFGEGRGVGDHVVRGEGADHGIRVASLDHRCGEGDGRHRVPRSRLGEHRIGPELRQLGAHRIRVPFTCHDDDPVTGERLEAVDGGLEQGATATCEVEEELGVACAAEGPQSGACPTSRHNGPESGNARHGR